MNGIVWKAVTFALKSKDLVVLQWELVLLEALHSVRPLLCTSTDATPHGGLLLYNRKSTSGISLSTSFTAPGPVALHLSAKSSKYDCLVDGAELLDCKRQ